MLALGCEAVVIHFLHAYANPAHELAAEATVRAVWPNRYVTVGHKILSEYREYERGCGLGQRRRPAGAGPLCRPSRPARLADGGYAHER
ncbi:MAG: hypothetical protein R3D25_01735 [Geminicoccaceae bacterium]